MNTKPPEVYDYLDAVQYLNAHLSWRKSKAANFSVSQWAANVGCSKVTLRFLLRRKRSITKAVMEAFVRDLLLDPKGAEYFEIMIAYNQARTITERNALGARLVSIQKSRFTQSVVEPVTSVLHAIAPVIMTALTFSDVEKTAAGLAKLLDLDVIAVASSLANLADEGVIKKCDDGTYSFTDRTFTIPDSIKLKEFYEFWIERSKEALLLPTSVRKYQSLKFALTPEEYQEVVECCQDYAVSLLSRFQSDIIGGRNLYMFESSLFPISNLREPAYKPAVQTATTNLQLSLKVESV